MITAHFAATLLSTILVWCLYGLICLGYGWFWKSLYLRGSTKPSDCVWSFWIGLATLLGLLQIWQLVLPVNGYAFCLFVGGGLLLSLRGIGPALAAVSTVPFRQRIAFATIVLPLVVWVADRATGPGDFYDSGLYHIPAMEWASHFGIVPGLANLSKNLGFTSSITLLAAMMNQGPSAGQAGHYLNCFFLAALGLMVVRGAVAVVAHGAKGRPDLWVMAFGWLAITEWGMDSQASSLSTDVGMMAISLAAAACFLQIRSTDEPDRRSFLIFCCCTLCAAGISAKASAVPFAGPLAVCALLATRRQPPPNRFAVRVVAACSVAAIIVGIWVLRQVILTGYPLFPTSYFATHVDWKVPLSRVEENQRIIRDWARTGWTTDTTKDYQWLHKWYRVRVQGVWNLWKGPIPFGVGVIFLVASAFLFRRRKQLGPAWRGLPWLLACVTIALTAWFITAPDPRFCTQLFFLVFACGPAVFWGMILRGTRRAWLRGIPVVLFIAIASGPIVQRWDEQFGVTDESPIDGWLRPGARGDLRPTPVAADLHWKFVQPGFSVLIPPDGHDQVWDAPLPNAPSIRDGLTLRNPRRFQDGFKIVPHP